MCGIGGELRFDSKAVDKDKMNKMLSRLERRGPDSSGIYVKENVGLVHRRLAVIDLSSSSAQPLFNADSTLAIVFNGTIYNYPELRREMQALGVHFQSQGDTEVILKAFELWGEACLSRLIGMFAFAIYDLRKKRLFLKKKTTRHTATLSRRLLTFLMSTSNQL